MNPYRIIASFRDQRIYCGVYFGKDLSEALAKAKKDKADWAKSALRCQPNQIQWEIEESMI